MEDVTHGKADYAVLPIENSTAGIVADIYDLLMEYKLYIVGEQIIRVDHVLLGMPDAQIGDIREVCSHHQGLAQCKATPQARPKRSVRWGTKAWQLSQAVRLVRYSV